MADGRGQKLVVVEPKSYGTDFILRSDVGGTEVNLLTAVNNVLFANVFVPSDPGGSQRVFQLDQLHKIECLLTGIH